MLKRIGDQSGQRLPGFLETHPDPGDRERVTAELAKQAVAGKGALVINQKVYVRRVDGILFGQDPQQGYFAGDQYFHPALRFQVSFPAGWSHRDTRAAVAAGEPNQAAMVQLSTAQGAANLAPEAFVAQLLANKSISAAHGARETIGGHSAWVGHLDVPSEDQTTTRLDAAFIRKDALLFQILGQSLKPGDVHEERIFSTIRSFRSLNDAARINVTPDRVRVHNVAASGSFDSVVKLLGALAADLETNSIMNNVQTDDRVLAGAQVKVVARLH
jgi:predicted Zn-dependent protease